jgi:tetratricopeptide (TPR) repeat protein
VPTSIRLEADETFGSGETIPTSLSLGKEEPPGFEATIPPPLEAGDSGGGVPVLPEGKPAGGKRGGLSVRTIMLIGFLGLILIGGLSAFGGYFSGIGARTNAESTAKALRAQEQYDLAVQDMQAKNYERARQRFEYVIQLDPNYSGVTDKLAEVLLELSITATPTFVPTPTLTPTPDTRSEEELFKQANDSLYNKDWSTAIDTALNLRRAKPDYQAVQVDGILYVSYRNRGADKILQQGDLEGGIYDLTLAERFAPLDADAASYLTWARLYILGASFWDVDWSQAVYYFGQVAPALPNLHDGSGWTATQRYRLALIGYGDYLANRREWCPAMQQYQQALSYGADQQVQEAYNRAIEKCEGPKQPEATQAPDTGSPDTPTEAAPTEETPPEAQPTVPTP